jgi:hypothetical protein
MFLIAARPAGWHSDFLKLGRSLKLSGMRFRPPDSWKSGADPDTEQGGPWSAAAFALSLYAFAIPAERSRRGEAPDLHVAP